MTANIKPFMKPYPFKLYKFPFPLNDNVIRTYIKSYVCITQP